MKMPLLVAHNNGIIDDSVKRFPHFQAEEILILGCTRLKDLKLMTKKYDLEPQKVKQAR